MQLALALGALLLVALEPLELALVALELALRVLIVRILRELLAQLTLLLAELLLFLGLLLVGAILLGLLGRFLERARRLLALLLIPLLVELLGLGGELFQLLARLD